MKRILTLITLAAAAATAVQAQPQSLPVNSNPMRSFFASEEWRQAFMGSFGVDAGVEPGVPTDTDEREALAQVRDLLTAGADEQLRPAITVLETLIRGQQAKGLKTSPMILQVVGAMEIRNSELTRNPAEQAQALRRAENYLLRAVDPNTGFPNYLGAHKNLGTVYFRLNEFTKAEKHFVRSLNLGAVDFLVYGFLGNMYLESGRLVAAEAALRQCLMLNPNVIEFRELLGSVLLQQERYNEAKELFAELILEKPNKAEYWMHQVNCFLPLEMPDEAAYNLEMVRMMGASTVDAMLLLGDIYLFKGMLPEGTDAYLGALKMDASDKNLEKFVASAERLNSQIAYELAMKVIQNINEAYANRIPDEEQINLLSLSSEINIALGKGAEAAVNLEDLLRRDPFNARALLALGDYYSSFRPEGDVNTDDAKLAISRAQQRAMIYFERAQQLDDPRSQVRAYIGEAQLRVKRRELQRAVDLLEEAQGIQYQDGVQAYLNQVRAFMQNTR